MRLNSYIITLFTLVFLASCSSVRNITNKDKSGSNVLVKKYGSEKREFINGIQVTLGTVTTTKQKTSTLTSGTAKKNNNGQSANNAITSTADIEKANWLQLKYAVVIDAPVENMNNIVLLEQIDKWWGVRYCIGGTTENCIDCSAFTQIIMRDVFNINLPRTAQEQYNAALRIELEDLSEGDLVFFGSGKRSISHVGVYLQNNKFVHASTSGGVTITDLSDKYWNPKYRGGGRIRN
jgi:cell wall-associated NlpC family hydrolase